VTVRSLADLGQGARGRIVELRLQPGRRALPGSPLQPGASVYVAEAPGGRWLHVRIDHREYSIPVGVARSVLIEVPRAEQPPSARDAYAVLVSRLDRNSWRVRVIDRASGVVARSEWFEDEAEARRRHDGLSADADALDAAAFRARYRLP
jgi:FeoA domain